MRYPNDLETVVIATIFNLEPRQRVTYSQILSELLSPNYIMLTSLDKYFFRLQFSAAESWMAVCLAWQFVHAVLKVG